LRHLPCCTVCSSNRAASSPYSRTAHNCLARQDETQHLLGPIGQNAIVWPYRRTTQLLAPTG